MENDDDNNMLERQTGINKAFGKMNFAIYSADIKNKTYLEVSTLDIFKENIPSEGNLKILFEMVVKYYVSDGYKDIMRSFLDMNTIEKRLESQNFVSCEFLGTTQGWCRANLIVEKRDKSGKISRLLYVTQEINAEVKNEQRRIEELKNAYREAAKASKAKTDFLFRMSHDIRTPLNAIIGLNELIAEYGADSEDILKCTRKIRESGNLLLALLNDILDMTKLEKENAVLDEDIFSVNEMADEISSVIRFNCEEKGQIYNLDIQNTEYDTLIGDKSRISRVLFNILCNASVYTAPGGEVNFSIREEEVKNSDKVNLICEIRDNGIGIENDLKDKIFERFQRGENNAVQSNPGTGLGLSVAKNFTDMMNGEIDVISSPGMGSTFIVKFPLKKSEGVKTASDNADVSFDGLRALIVDDNSLNLEIVKELLTVSGIICDTALSGKEAIEKINSSPEGQYSFIIMDIFMPQMDGYETTRFIRSMKRNDTGNIPIIALTANTFADDMEKSIKAGMNAHLAKPLDMKLLLKTINELVKR